MNPDYLRNVKTLYEKSLIKGVSVGSIEPGRCFYYVYDYKDTPNEKLYEYHYQFFQKYLKERFSAYNIPPTTIFYNCCNSINAWADVKKNTGMISINRGTLLILADLFDFNDEILKRNKLLDGIRRLQPSLDRTTQQLMYETSMLYLFYHELAHIIQDSELTQNEFIQEIESSERDDFQLNSHIMEIDADLFAAICLGQHVLVYWRKLQQNERNKTNLLNIMSIVVGGLSIYRLLLFSKSPPIYYRKYKHPHISIRIAGIITNIILYINIELLANNELPNDQLKKDNGFEVILPIIEYLSKEIIGDKVFNNFSQLYYTESENIAEYYDEIIGYIRKNPATAYVKRKKLGSIYGV